MERLTERDEFGNADIIGVDSEDLQLNLDFEQMNKVPDSLNKLAEYEDLEEQGLLLRLPCKVGASVYMVGQDCGGDGLYCRRGDCEGCPDLYNFVAENEFEAYMLEDIGKTVFLTKAEAEQKLKEMEGSHE